MEVPMVQKLHHIHRSHQFGRGYNGIVLRSRFGVDDQQSVGAKSETRESREESEVHRPYLMLGSDEPVRCLAGNRRKTLGGENHVAYDSGCYHYRQHDTQKRPPYDLESAFHFVVTTLVKLNLIDLCSFS